MIHRRPRSSTSLLRSQLLESFALSPCIKYDTYASWDHGDEHDMFPHTNFNLDWAIDFLINPACSGVTGLTFVLDAKVVLYVERDWLDRMFGVLVGRTSLLTAFKARRL